MPARKDSDIIIPTVTTKNTSITNTENKSGSTKKKPKDSFGRKITNKIHGTLEAFFARLGFMVATHPWKIILISLIVFGICLIGTLAQKVENRVDKIWVSQSSDLLKHKKWVGKYYPSKFRRANVIIEVKGGDILTSKGLQDMYKLHRRVTSLYNGTMTLQWEDIGYKSSEKCVPPASILELWSYNITTIERLTAEKIKAKINKKPVISPLTGKHLDIHHLLGGPITQDTNGTITKASSAQISYKIQRNEVFDSEKGKGVDKNGDAWEEAFDTEMRQGSTGYTIYSYSKWAHEKAENNATENDLQFLLCGYILVIIYLSSMLGTFSRIGQKVYIAFTGIAVIGISLGTCYGLGPVLQLKFNALHKILPFLLLGIGVDDIFVIIQTWYNVGGPKQDGRSIPEKVSKTLQYAGVSILVTSVTNICAFLIGATTVLPGLKSFCIYAGIGILAVFIYTITFFVAWLTIDAKRQKCKRDACFCCITFGDKWEPMACSKKNYLQSFLKNIYAPALLSVPGKIIAILATCGMLVGGGVGLSNLKQEFDPNWFLPVSSGPRQYTAHVEKSFPNSRVASAVYTGNINYYTEHNAMMQIVKVLKGDKYVTSASVHSWYDYYHTWLKNSHLKDLNPKTGQLKDEQQFYNLLQVYLNTSGQAFKKDLNIHGKKIMASAITFKHSRFDGSAMETKGMDLIVSKIKKIRIKSEKNKLLPFAYTEQYLGRETDKIIVTELKRNLLLAGVCVFVVTLFLLSSIRASLMVVVCVVLALIDIAGYMHFWNLTIDTVTTIIMVVAIGLTIDYSAHIAHGFMVANGGSRNDRMREALSDIGPAVIHGGISTLLAFILLVASESYIFFTFFQVFFLVVAIGMFHGLVFLPVILSLIGPNPFSTHDNDMTIIQVNVKSNLPTDEPIHHQNVTQKGEMFLTIKTNGSVQNEAYVPE